MVRSSRRFLIAAIALAMTLSAAVAQPASASRKGPTVGVEQQKRLFRWLLGSATNPPFASPDLCGEVVAGEFLLNVTGPGHATTTCTIRKGTPILGLVGGAVGHNPTPQSALADLGPGLGGLSDPAARLDSKPLAFNFARTTPYRFSIAPGAFVQQVNPNLAHATTGWAASTGWTVRIPHLAKGKHTLELSTNIDGEPAVFTYKITVR